MRVWCLTTSPDNFAKTAEQGWTIQGIKARRHKTATQISPGDKIVYYVTKEIAFGAVVEVASPFFEDHEPIWTSKPGRARRGDGPADREDYPWRFEITPEVVVEDPERWVPVDAVYEGLQFPKRWPPEHYKLAFQGNIREWPWSDYEVVKAALEKATG